MLQNILAKLRSRGQPDMRQFSADKGEFERRRNGLDLEGIFANHDGRIVHKWLDYIPTYARFLEPYRGTPAKVLEIGVSHGGSLDVWRRFLGPEATIFGIDNNPACAGYVDPPNEVRIGSQADPLFLESVIAEMGGLDVVLDDGSHVASHQRASLGALWPHLAFGGLYIIEDIHTSYWPKCEGGYRRAGTAVELAKEIIDDQHAWFHLRPETALPKEEIGALTVYESMFVIEKKRKQRPVHVRFP